MATDPPEEAPQLSALPMFAPPSNLSRSDPPSQSHSTQSNPGELSSELPPPLPQQSPNIQRLYPPDAQSDQPTQSPAPTVTCTDDKPRPSAGGDPTEVAKALSGLLVIITGALALAAARRGRWLRQPTPVQRDEIAAPLARVMTRHLPMQLLGPDMVDATTAAAAVHTYVLDGPLLTGAPAVEIVPDDQMPEPEPEVLANA